MQSCSLHRRFSSQYQALDGLPSVAAPGARRMVSCSCLHSPARRPAHVSHDSGHAELVLGCMYTCFATLLLVSLIPLPSQCNTLKPVLDWSVLIVPRILSCPSYIQYLASYPGSSPSLGTRLCNTICGDCFVLHSSNI